MLLVNYWLIIDGSFTNHVTINKTKTSRKINSLSFFFFCVAILSFLSPVELPFSPP